MQSKKPRLMRSFYAFFEVEGLDFLPVPVVLKIYGVSKGVAEYIIRRLEGPLQMEGSDLSAQMKLLDTIALIMQKEGHPYERIIQLPPKIKCSYFSSARFPLTLLGPCEFDGSILAESNLTLKDVHIIGRRKKKIEIFKLSLRIRSGVLLKMYGGSIHTPYGGIYASHHSRAYLENVSIYAHSGISVHRKADIRLKGCDVTGEFAMCMYGGTLRLDESTIETAVIYPKGGKIYENGEICKNWSKYILRE